MAFSVDVTNDWVDYATALGTLAAVGIAVWDSTRANRRAARAEAETEELRHHQTIARNNADAAAWADKGAVHVRSKLEVLGPISGDLQVPVKVTVSNEGEATFRTVRVIVDPPKSLSVSGSTMLSSRMIASWDKVGPGETATQAVTLYMGSPEDPDFYNIQFHTLFSDQFGNRWRLTKDGSLLLSQRRKLGVDDTPIDETEIGGTSEAINNYS